MFGLGTPEIILIAIVILVLFGAKKIPDLMSGMGKGIKEFKRASSDFGDELKGDKTTSNVSDDESLRLENERLKTQLENERLKRELEIQRQSNNPS
ncbi:hypothetical protein BH10BAC5_BH10BAC5_29250 [soil metagenome]